MPLTAGAPQRPLPKGLATTKTHEGKKGIRWLLKAKRNLQRLKKIDAQRKRMAVLEANCEPLGNCEAVPAPGKQQDGFSSDRHDDDGQLERLLELLNAAFPESPRG